MVSLSEGSHNNLFDYKNRILLINDIFIFCYSFCSIWNDKKRKEIKITVFCIINRLKPSKQ